MYRDDYDTEVIRADDIQGGDTIVDWPEFWDVEGVAHMDDDTVEVNVRNRYRKVESREYNPDQEVEVIA